MEFPTEKYDIIYADPPWQYDVSHTFNGNTGKRTAGAVDHYNTMSIGELKKIPVKNICEKNCLLFMWCTSPKLKVGIELGESWGFKYITVAFCWDKQVTMASHYCLSQIEFVLVFRKGTIPKQRMSRNELQFLSERRSKKHSEKPATIRQRIEAMFPHHKKIELFAREKFEGWSFWGNDKNLLPVS